MSSSVQAAFTLGLAIKSKTERGLSIQSIAAEIGMGDHALTTRLNMTRFSDLIINKITRGELESLPLSCVGLLANYGVPTLAAVWDVVNNYGNDKTKELHSLQSIRSMNAEEQLRLLQNVIFARLLDKKRVFNNQYIWLSDEVTRLRGLSDADLPPPEKEPEVQEEPVAPPAPQAAPVEEVSLPPKVEVASKVGEQTPKASTNEGVRVEPPKGKRRETYVEVMKETKPLSSPTTHSAKQQSFTRDMLLRSVPRPIAKAPSKLRVLTEETMGRFEVIHKRFKEGISTNALHERTLRQTFMVIEDPEEYLRIYNAGHFKYQTEGKPMPDHFPNPEDVQEYVDSLKHNK